MIISLIAVVIAIIVIFSYMIGNAKKKDKGNRPTSDSERV